MATTRHLALGLALSVLVTAAPVGAQSAERAYFEAYYIHHEKGDLTAALTLYEKIAQDRRAPAGIRKKAKAAARAVAEELACSDFASLMPAETIFYMEFNRPGAQMRTLLDQLGLLRNGDSGAADFGISPLLVDGLLGMRGAAVAVTGIDPRQGPNNGVVILHPGDLDVVRGLMETALPVGGQPADPIGGHPTWRVENEAWVTLTSQLLIASPTRGEIEAVVARLSGDGDSLADSDRLSRAMEMRGDDVMFFCVNLEPVMPMIMDAIRNETRRDPGAQAALAFLDLESTRSIAGRAGVDGDGLSFDVSLELDENHRNLAFNLLRMPNIDEDTLGMVPAGAAAFLAGTINNDGKVPPGAQDAKGRPVVTLMDFGRELFANIADVAVYVMPKVHRAPWGPMPEVALALRVNDPERSRALWEFVLGTAQAATGGKAGPDSKRSAKARIDRYEIEGVPVFVAVSDRDLIVSPSENAVKASLEARSKNRSVLKDPAFEKALKHFGAGSIRSMAVNVGRCAQIATHFMSEREQREMKPFAQVLAETSMSFSVQQTANRMGVSGRISGIPNVGPMVAQMISQEMGRSRSSSRRISMAMDAPSAGVAVRSAPQKTATTSIEQAVTVEATSAEDLREIFDKLHATSHFEEAEAVAKGLRLKAKSDPFTLNNFAWALLTEEQYGSRYDDLATKIAYDANEASSWGNWYYLDTYATALFKKGQYDKAIEIERKAIEVGGDDPRIQEAKDTLKRFQEAAKKAKGRRGKKAVSKSTGVS